jgi:hypothetical protein
MANNILSTATDIGSVLAAYEAAAAQGRVQQAGVNQNQANTGANLYRTQLQGALTGPSVSAAQAAKGDAQANIQPFAWTGGTTMAGNIPVPQSTGGLTPSLFGPATRQAGQKLAALGNSRVLSPAFALPTPPTLAPAPTASGLDKTLGAAGLITSAVGALNKPGGSGASFPIPFSGFGGPSSQGPAGSDFGASDAADQAHNLEGGSGAFDPTQSLGGTTADPVQEYLDWLARQQAGGADATPSAGDAWGNP